MNKRKTILIVDDSDIDRTILKTVLSDDFEINEKSSGFAAINFLGTNKEKLDAILLDVSMPAVDGFDVLKFMKESGINNVPVFLITSEATRDNVERAAHYGVTELIRKPFDNKYILRRIKHQVGMVSNEPLSDEDIQETRNYIASLETVYNRYLRNFGKDAGHYKRMSDLMRIMLTEYAVGNTEPALDKTRIELISKAGYFCNIGDMSVPSETIIPSGKPGFIQDNRLYHVIAGADIIGLNRSKHCRYFIDVCTDICLHHHERYDGKGFPHKVIGEHNLIYSQIARLACDFDRLFFQYQGHSKTQFIFVTSELAKDEGNVSKKILSTLTDCSKEILDYYQALK